MESGSIQRYIFYAIGEIALVMIGILLALQVNNWNEYRKDRKEEQSYLIRLLSELHADSSGLAGAIKLNGFKVDDAQNNLDQMMGTAKQEFDTLDFLRQASLIGIVPLHRPDLSTYGELISSGKLNILQNDQLRSALASHIKRFNNFEFSIYSATEQYRKSYSDHLYQYFSPLIFDEISQARFENRESPSVEQLKKMGFDKTGYLADPKSLYHLRNIAWTHERLFGAFTGNLDHVVIPLMDLVREEIK